MKATVRKWGNSGAVRIPASVLDAARLNVDEDVDVREEKGRIVIEPLRRKSFRLEDLVNGINRNNLPGLVDFGPPAGREIW